MNVYLALGALPGITKEYHGRTRAAISPSAVNHIQQQIMAKTLYAYINQIYLILSLQVTMIRINH